MASAPSWNQTKVQVVYIAYSEYPTYLLNPIQGVLQTCMFTQLVQVQHLLAQDSMEITTQRFELQSFCPSASTTWHIDASIYLHRVLLLQDRNRQHFLGAKCCAILHRLVIEATDCDHRHPGEAYHVPRAGRKHGTHDLLTTNCETTE